MPRLSLLLFDDGCVALWALRHFAMIPVADATGSDLSPSGLAGFIGPIKHLGPTRRRGAAHARLEDFKVCMRV